MIKTIIVALHKRERESIALSLADSGDIKVIARGEDGYDALKLTGAMNPDIAILDADLGFIGGEEIPPLLKARSPSTAVVIVAGVIDDSRLFTAAVNGVSGFVRKETDMYMLPSILNCVFSGGCFISPLFAARLLRLLPSTAGGKTPSKAPPAGSAGIPRTRGDRAARFPPSEDPAGCLNKRELQSLPV